MNLEQKDKLANFFYKLAEYTFAGLAIGAIATRPIDLGKILIMGMGGTFAFAFMGFHLDGLKERRK